MIALNVTLLLSTDWVHATARLLESSKSEPKSPEPGELSVKAIRGPAETGLHELPVSDGAFKELIQERARAAERFSQAVDGGRQTLKAGGMEKSLMGLTDIKMVRSVCVR